MRERDRPHRARGAHVRERDSPASVVSGGPSREGGAMSGDTLFVVAKSDDSSGTKGRRVRERD